MKNNKGVGFGVFLLTVGIIWVLVSVGVISWSIINALFVLWPLILVIIGVNIIFRNNKIIRAVAWAAFLTVLISYSYIFDDKTNAGGIRTGEKVTIEKLAEVQKGNLKIAFGGTRISLDSGTLKLLEAEIQDKDITYAEKSLDGETSISFDKKAYSISNFNTNLNNRNNRFHLSSQVPWHIDIDTGAVDGSFDMSGLSVEKLSLDTGAANLALTLGAKYSNPVVDINAGASKIEINVPSDAGVKVRMDGALNSTNLDGSDWEKKNGVYYSKGYDEASVKIDMDIDMGVGKLLVNFK
ncbi:MAG: hypothetical protein FIA99_00720 [Ruminiclostridium sp.]|nr:hypothetical protein [Ruminiclostridium sp.]